MATAVIASGASLSGEVVLNPMHGTIVGVAMPAEWTAADLTFQVSVDGGTTWLEVLRPDDGNALTVQVAAASYTPLAPTDLFGAKRIKVRSGTSGTPVNQAAGRTITLEMRPL
jgi:hypothetical protein